MMSKWHPISSEYVPSNVSDILEILPHSIETLAALLALSERNPPVTTRVSNGKLSRFLCRQSVYASGWTNSRLVGGPRPHETHVTSFQYRCDQQSYFFYFQSVIYNSCVWIYVGVGGERIILSSIDNQHNTYMHNIGHTIHNIYLRLISWTIC